MTTQINKQCLDWDKLNDTIKGLDTDIEHVGEVQREAIPLVFLPGIMGSVLRRSGTTGEGKGTDGLPNMRWDPGDPKFMWWQYSGVDGATRRRMVVGPSGDEFDEGFLKVHNTNPEGDGFQGVSKSTYHPFLAFLRNQSHWGPLTNLFEFPVYAIGYNWSDTNKNNGKKVAKRIDDIIAEAKSVTGKCEKVILITHSMGGLVGRSATLLWGAKDKVAGIVHGVQPVTGSCGAYWRVKAGFEGFGPASRVLGNSGKNVTPILGNMPGGLELLPNKHYFDGDNSKQWLTVKHQGRVELALPKADPYTEIYRVKATGDETKHKGRKFWALIDPDLLDPGRQVVQANENSLDGLAAAAAVEPWDQYINQLNKAEAFHTQLKDDFHDNTFCFHGTDHDSAERIEYKTDTVWVERDSYRTRAFWGRFSWNNQDLRGKLQDPDGDGDGTVGTCSGSAISAQSTEQANKREYQRKVLPHSGKMEHEPAYNDTGAREFVVQAILSICQEKIKDVTK